MKRKFITVMFSSIVLLLGMGTSSAKPAENRARVPTILKLSRPAGGEWMGLYVLGKKAGYIFTDLREGKFNNKKVIAVVNKFVLNASVGGTQAQREIREERFYEYRDQGRLVGFHVEHLGDGGNETLVGKCSPKGIELKRIRPGQPDEVRQLPPTRETVEFADAPRLVAFSRESVSQTFLDIEDTLADKRSFTKYLGESSFVAAGLSVPVVRVQSVEENNKLDIVVTIDREGRVLETRFGESMIGKAESESLAKQLDKIDLFSLTRVKINRSLSSSVRSSEQIGWQIRGIPKQWRESSYRQQFEEQSDGSVKLTVTARPPQKLLPRPLAANGDPQITEALRSNLAVEASAPAVVELSKKVVGNEKDAWTAARKINSFVNQFLEKSYGTSSDRVTDLLVTRKGDCTEHALLMTALARAAGIPARRVDGLVYMETSDAVPALYWHEWVEVYVGEWVAMDPTFNQTVADPTHVALGIEARADTAGLIGQLQISEVWEGKK